MAPSPGSETLGSVVETEERSVVWTQGLRMSPTTVGTADGDDRKLRTDSTA
jgi:hypothetical protein